MLPSGAKGGSLVRARPNFCLRRPLPFRTGTDGPRQPPPSPRRPRPGYALDGAVARVAHRKYAWHAGLERQRLMLQRPSLLGNVTPCQDVLAVVALDDVAKPFRSRFGTDHDEDRRRGDFLALPVSTFSNVRISRRSPPRPSTTRVRRRTSTSVL